jgi:hypothetical protein
MLGGPSSTEKKYIAACLSVSAALLITISTSGDFQRKWQANRIAAANLEKIGCDLLARPGADPRIYFAAIGTISHQRHAAIDIQTGLPGCIFRGAIEIKKGALRSLNAHGGLLARPTPRAGCSASGALGVLSEKSRRVFFTGSRRRLKGATLSRCRRAVGRGSPLDLPVPP